MISLHTTNPRIASRQSGLSIVELLVAMLLGLFLLIAVAEIMINGSSAFGSANSMSRLQENGRIGTNLLVTDLKRAGYMGGNSDVPNIYGTTGKATAAVTCATGDTTWARMVTQPIVGIDDSNAGYACIPNADYLRGDVVAMRYVAPWIEDPDALDKNRLYLRSSLFEGKIFVGDDEADSINTVLDEPQNVRALQAFAYFVGDSGRTCNGDPVPSLFRVGLNDNGKPEVEELLPGVEHLQAQYGVNGQYLDADEVALADWENVLTVRIWLLVRAECAENGYTDNRLYTMGNQEYKPKDNFRRQVYSSVVMLRN